MARIQPRSLAQNHSFGVSTQTKMVDFGICLVPSPELHTRIRSHLAPLDTKQQSINQTLMKPVRISPITINAEIKITFEGGQKGDVQESIWVGAGMNRLRRIPPKRASADQHSTRTRSEILSKRPKRQFKRNWTTRRGHTWKTKPMPPRPREAYKLSSSWSYNYRRLHPGRGTYASERQRVFGLRAHGAKCSSIQLRRRQSV